MHKMTFLEQLNRIETESSKVLGKFPTEILLLNSDSKVVAAAFMPEDNVILVNSIYTELTPTVIGFLAHETRHAYQHQVIHGDINPKPSDNPELWKKEFDNHIKPSEDNMVDYATQAIEVDAIAYSEIFINKMLKRKLKIDVPGYLRPLIEERKAIIEKELNFDESSKEAFIVSI
jgi:hypothetical protein